MGKAHACVDSLTATPTPNGHDTLELCAMHTVNCIGQQDTITIHTHTRKATFEALYLQCLRIAVL